MKSEHNSAISAIITIIYIYSMKKIKRLLIHTKTQLKVNQF